MTFLNFIAFKMNIISMWKRIVDTGVVNDITHTRQSVITRMVIRFLWHEITGASYDKQYSDIRFLCGGYSFHCNPGIETNS